jgi:protease-4
MSITSVFQTLRDSAVLRIVGNVLLFVVTPLVAGWFIAQALLPQPQVAIIGVRWEIFSDSTAVLMAEIEAAREDPNIKAVVVQLNSPGGSSTDGQALHLELRKLRQEKPVVGSVDLMAASAGYRIATATDPLYAKPGSLIGNVGTIGRFPSSQPIDDFILSTGPFKLSADNTEEFVRRMEENKQEFLATVLAGRGDRLTLSPEELSQGLLYSGRQAQRLGLIDQIGSQTEAIEKAAELAGIRNYEVVSLEAAAIEKVFGPFESAAGTAERPMVSYADNEAVDTLLAGLFAEFLKSEPGLLELWPGAVDSEAILPAAAPDRQQLPDSEQGGVK